MRKSVLTKVFAPLIMALVLLFAAAGTASAHAPRGACTNCHGGKKAAVTRRAPAKKAVRRVVRVAAKAVRVARPAAPAAGNKWIVRFDRVYKITQPSNRTMLTPIK